MVLNAFTKKIIQAVFLSIIIVIVHFTVDLSEYDKLSLIDKFNQVETESSKDLVIIKIDKTSIDHFKNWPWPRSIYGKLLEKLQDSAPKLIVFDVDFSSHSDFYNDNKFSDAIKHVSYPVILPSFISSYEKNPDDDTRYIENVPIPALRKYTLLSNANTISHSDGAVYHYTTFGLNGRPTIGALLANKPYITNSPILIDYRLNLLSIPQISFKDVIDGNFSSDFFRNKKIIIGATSIELGDMYTLPKYGRVPGLFVHALGYESIISKDYFSVVSPNNKLTIAILLVFFLTFIHRKHKLLLSLSINALAFAAFYFTSIILYHFMMIILNEWLIYTALIISSSMQILINIRYRTNILLEQTNKNNYNKALLNQLISDNSNGIIITNLNGSILVANKKINQIFNINKKVVNNREPIFDYVPGSKELLLKVSNDEHDKTSNIEFKQQKIINEKGDEFNIEIMVNKANFVQNIGNGKKSSNHEIYNFMITDITEKMNIIAAKNKTESALLDIKNNDPLTKLPNRNSFNDLMVATLANLNHKKTCIIMLISFDSIKDINQVYGMHLGDDALCQIALLLKEIVGKQGVVSRYSAKVYGIIYNHIDDVDNDDLIKLIQNVYKQFSKPLDLHGKEIIISASMGVAIAGKHGNAPEILMSNANQALDYAKQSTTINWYIYEEDLAQKIRAKKAIKEELQRAIQNNELVLFYQPQHNIATGALIGYEALVRWEDPVKGLRYPDEFIPIAEEYGMISDLGKYVLKLGCMDAANWPEDISVAINVSPAQFIDCDIAALCKEYLALSGLPASRLEIEVTESMMMDDVNSVIKTLGEIKALGIKIAMDDFGTGYSSLQYLTELPFDKIKIDRSFTMNIGKSKQADALISTIVALGHSLDKIVLAEGIETAEMIILLKAAGCQIGQGYHYGKPVSVKEVQKQLELIQIIDEDCKENHHITHKTAANLL